MIEDLWILCGPYTERHRSFSLLTGFTLINCFCLLCYHFLYVHLLIHSFLQLPEEARELEKELRQITKEKNEAVRSQDFEKVKLVVFYVFAGCWLHCYRKLRRPHLGLV